MYIFIDTNIFFNNWQLRSPQFQLLSNFANNTNTCILMPKVICEEIENKYQDEMEKVKNDLKKAARKAGDFCESHFEVNLSQLQNYEYDFVNTINYRFPNVEFISYDEVSHSILLNKAIKGRRPFREKEKGYRDSLIWMSLLAHIKAKNIIEDIVFITNNSSDFFESKGQDLDLHGDIKDDLEANNINNNFILYNSLKSFLDSSVKEELHKFKHDDLEEISEKFGEVFEDATEVNTVDHMNDLTPPRISYYF